MMSIFSFSQSVEAMAILVFLLSFLVSYLAIPRVIAVVKIKNLMDSPNERSSHTYKTPTMGGIAFYISLITSLFFIRNFDTEQVGINIVAGLTILFFTGLKDDLVGVRPSTKIWGQIIVTFIIIFGTNTLFSSFNNFLWIDEIPFWLSVFFSCFLILLIVNSYNLIDGINGLASLIGIVIFSCFAFIFYNVSKPYYFLISVLCIGYLVAFLRFNLSSSVKNKIFMGDTGSMIVGFMVGILALRFLALTPSELENAYVRPYNKVLILVAIVFVPFIDTVRVFLSRTLRTGKPFKADRSHIHHVMIDYMNLSHFRSSVTLALINIIIFILTLCANTFMKSGYLLIFVLLISITTSVVFFYFSRSYVVRKDKQKIRKVIDRISPSRKKKNFGK